MKKIDPAFDPKRVVVLNDVLNNLIASLDELEGIDLSADRETVMWIGERVLLFKRLADMFDMIANLSIDSDVAKNALYNDNLPEIIADIRNLATVMIDND